MAEERIRERRDAEDQRFARLFDAMIRVAEAPPDRPGTNVFAAKVPWSRIIELRAAMDACGIGWEADR